MIIDNTYFEKDPIYISGIANRKDDKPTAVSYTQIRAHETARKISKAG